MYRSAPILGNEDPAIIQYDAVVTQSLTTTRSQMNGDQGPTVVISARCDLLKAQLTELYKQISASNS